MLIKEIGKHEYFQSRTKNCVTFPPVHKQQESHGTYTKNS